MSAHLSRFSKAGRFAARRSGPGRTNWCLLVAINCLLLMIAAGAAAKCPIERARYRMIHDPDITAGFQRVRPSPDWPSELAFFVHSRSKQYVYSIPRRGSKQVTYWFRFKASEKRHIYMVVLKARPTLSNTPGDDGRVGGTMGDARFMAADSGFLFSPKIPTRQAERPEFILLPDLSDALRHLVDRTEDAPTDFFKFSGCARPGDR